MIVLFAAVVLALAAVAFVVYPVLTGREAPLSRDDEELTEAQHRKRVALLSLRDVEYDYHAGKLDETDYRNLKREISNEALDAIDEEEAEWLQRESARARTTGGATPGAPGIGIPDDLEAEIATLRASIREGVVCPHCGHPNPRGSRYCGDCGSALPQEVVGSEPGSRGAT